MVTSLKNVLIVDGTGWFPYWTDVLIEDGKIKDILSGENVAIREEKNFGKVINYKVGEYPGAYVIPGFDSDMTMEKYEKEVEEIAAGMKNGIKIEKTIRKMTGFGVGQREYLVPGMAANVAVISKDATKILAAFADGKEL